MINAFPSNARSLCNGPRCFVVLAVFVVVGALLALPLFIGSASAPLTPVNSSTEKYKINYATSASANVVVPRFNLLSPMPQAGPVTVETFAGNCSDPKTVFNLQDTDLKVCAKFT